MQWRDDTTPPTAALRDFGPVYVGFGQNRRWRPGPAVRLFPLSPESAHPADYPYHSRNTALSKPITGLAHGSKVEDRHRVEHAEFCYRSRTCGVLGGVSCMLW